MIDQVSLYNASYEKIIEIDWKKAVVLMMNGKVSSYSETDFHIIQTTSGIFKLPKNIVLKKYVYIPYKEFAPSRKNIFKRDEFICQYCSIKLERTQATVDHVIPRCRGGQHTWNNVVCCCLRCNRKKGDRTPSEANMPLLRDPKPLKFGY